MKHLRIGVAGLILAAFVAACGGPVDESLLPTPVPTYGPERFVVDPSAVVGQAEVEAAVEAPETAAPEAEPTATPEAEPTATPEPVVQAVEPVDEAEGEDAETPDVAEADAAPAVEPDAEIEAQDEPADPGADAADEAAETQDEPLPAPEDATEDTSGEAIEDATEAGVEETAPGVSEEASDEAQEAGEASADEEAVNAVNPDWEGLPEPVLAAMATADPGRGQQISLAQGCVGCHAMNPDQIMAGPTWHDMANTARTRVEGESAGLYLYNSIMYPNDYIVPGYMPNIMLQIYDTILSDQDTADIIAYLLTLEAGE